MNNRRGFLKTVAAGIAATPVLGSESLTGQAPSQTDQIVVKKWTRDGLNFAEFTMPITVPPHFTRADKDEVRYFIVPPFDVVEMEKQGNTKADIIDKCVSSFDNSRFVERKSSARDTEDGTMVIAKRDKFGKFENTIEAKEATNITIVRVHGRPNIMGVIVTPYPVKPKTDHYQVPQRFTV